MRMIGSESSSADFSLYIHIPFCTTKCGYCHFYVIPYSLEQERDFLRGIEKEWQLHREVLGKCKLVSIYFGGGTPSLLTVDAVSSILSHIHHSGLDVAEDCEITLEANPESVSLEKMRALRMLGINRISLGIQSLDDNELLLLDRRHRATRALQAIEDSKAAGIDNLSIDLMYDIPNQSFGSWKRTVDRAINLPITHLSLYNLTIEPMTAFFKKKKQIKPLLPSEEVSLQMLEYLLSVSLHAGLNRYEISAFARRGLHARHNTGYWTARPFLGLGPSAFSYIEGRRFKNISSLKSWASSLHANISPIDFEERLSQEAAFRELFAIHLRLVEGVDWQQFISHHGPPPADISATLDRLMQEDLLLKQNATIRLTDKGLLFYDSVAEALI